MTVKVYNLHRDGNIKLSESFKVKEFASSDGAETIYIDVDYVKHKLQKIRNYFNKPVRITSGYRSPDFNRRCGGISNSAHVVGRAFDITVEGVSIKKVAGYANQIGCRCVIRYDNLNFVHVDSRDYYKGVTLSNGNRIVVSGFPYKDERKTKFKALQETKVYEKPDRDAQVVKIIKEDSYFFTQNRYRKVKNVKYKGKKVKQYWHRLRENQWVCTKGLKVYCKNLGVI